MQKIRFHGWNVGMRKISFTLLLKEAGFRLKFAKLVNDRVLDGEQVVLEIQNINDALELIEKSRALGVKCELIDENTTDYQVASVDKSLAQ